MTTDELLEEINRYGCKWIIWTGGEPALQLTDAIVTFFKEAGYLQAIETNGTRKIPAGIDYITCSPKQDFEKVRELIPRVDELRFPMQKGDPLPNIAILPETTRYLLSPIFDNDRIIPENVDYCISLIKDNPVWALSLQTHKLIGIR